MVRSLRFSILLTMLILPFQTTDVTSSEGITCEFRTGQAPSINLTCLYPEGTNVAQSHLTVYFKKTSMTDPVSVVDCMRADEKKDVECTVEPGYYYDKVMYNNHTSIQIINASDTHLGTYECQLMYSGLEFEKCELTARHLAQLHEALTSPSPDWHTRLATETRSSSAVPETVAERGSEGSTQGTQDQELTTTHPYGDNNTKLEEGNHTKSFATGFGVGGFLFILLIVGAFWCLWRKGYCSNLKWLPCTAKKTQRHMKKDDSAGEEERKKLMTSRKISDEFSGEPAGPAEKEEIGGLAEVDVHCRHTTDGTIIDINENTPYVSPEPDRLQNQENSVGEHVAAESRDNIDGPGTNIEEVSTPQTAASSRTENDRGTISPRLSSRRVNNMSDRSKDTEDKAGLVHPDSQEQTGEGACSHQRATVSITREPDRPEAIEEQTRPSNDGTPETTSNGSDTNSVPAGQKKPQRKVSSKEFDDRRFQPVVSAFCKIISPCGKRAKDIRLETITTEKTTKPSGEVTERTETVTATCSLMKSSDEKSSDEKSSDEKSSDEDVSLSDLKITKTKKTDEKKSISRDGAKESSALPERDCDVRKPFKMKREASSPENKYASGWSNTDKRGIPVQEESHTSNTSSELATGFEKQRGNPTDNCSSSCQNNQNLSPTSTFEDSPEKTEEQQDTKRYDANVSLATKNAQAVSEEEESETLTPSPTAGSNMKVRKL